MKDTFYFSHDYHARSDEKILRLRAKYGAKGYGIYWMLVEIMAEGSAPHIILNDIPAIAVSINEDAKWLEDFIDFCIDEARLFLCDGEEFTAKRIVKHKIFREKFRQKGLEGADKRWGKYSPPISNPNSPPISNPNAKESKVKESKEDTTISQSVLQTYVDKWNSILPTVVKSLSRRRIEHLTARLREREFVDNYDAMLQKIVASDFLMGRTPREDKHKNWKLTFDWVIRNDDNYIKILEGKYDNAVKRDRGDV